MADTASEIASRSFSGTVLDSRRGPPVEEMARLQSFSEVNDVLRSRDFEHVTGHRDNAPFLGGSLLSLSGDDHFSRRRITAALFGPAAVTRYEAEVFMPALEEGLARWPRGSDGRAIGDLTQVLHRALSKLAAAIVGLDGLDDEEALRRHMACTSHVSVGVNIEFVERDHLEVTRECLPFVERFREEFFEPAWEKRRTLVERFAAGEIGREELPLDLITLMLLHQDHFSAFGPDATLREALLFNGASGGINHAACNTVDALLRWVEQDPAARRPLLQDMSFLRRSAFEAMRVRPATPFQIRKSRCDQILKSGRAVAAEEYVLLDMVQANRDPTVFGDTANLFDPFRVPIERTKPAGLTFSNGAHTCIAMNLSVANDARSEDGIHGLLVAVLALLFERDVRISVAGAAKPKAGTTRAEFDTFPISLALPSGTSAP